jgi:hypothetical protein
MDLYITLVPKSQPDIAWTTALHFSGSHVCNCLLSSIAYGTPSWAKIIPTLSFDKGNTTKPERLLEPCFERSLAGGRGLTVSFQHACDLIYIYLSLMYGES